MPQKTINILLASLPQQKIHLNWLFSSAVKIFIFSWATSLIHTIIIDKITDLPKLQFSLQV